MHFNNLNLIEPLLSAVTECGYDEPTPIQRETIPPVLAGRDVLGCAQTGTGKTAAFALPILQRLHTERKQHTGKRTIRTLILTPTRELALQIYENFASYGKRLPLRACVIFGGVGQQPQVDQLNRGVDILVATPGRLNDLIGQGFISLSHLEIFVLDEADRMLDMGFIHDVRKVIALLPEKRQTLLFSATMPAEVEKLALGILTKPVTVKVDPVSSTVDAIEQSLYLVDKANKKNLLAELLRGPEVESALVFTRTKHGADRVVRELSRAGIQSKAIHGDKSQSARQQALMEFKSGKIHVMVATDIAARGIDIAGLSHVFNYDLPNEPEAYVHRIGRTGRAGMEGSAVSFCCIDEMKELSAIEKLIGKALPRRESAWPMEVFTETVKQPRQPRPSRRVETVQPERGVRQSAPGRDLRGKPAPAQPERQPARKQIDERRRAAKPSGRSQEKHEPQERGAEVRQAQMTKATPLERPVRATPLRAASNHADGGRFSRTEERPQARESAYVREPMPEPMVPQRRAPKRPLATGQDRR